MSPESSLPPSTIPERHVPVLLDEVVTLLAPRPGDWVVDGTLGRGGHSLALAGLLGPSGHLVGIDRDLSTLEGTRPRLQTLGDRFHAFHACFSSIPEILTLLEQPRVDRVLLDLGVSSIQLDTAERGFSFRFEGPLDMRMDPSSGETAAALIGRLPEKELADLIYRYGEERQSRRIAKRIVEARRTRSIETTGELADLVRASIPGLSKIDKATRTFQALRIAVNDELGELEAGLNTIPMLLRPGGRLAVISFHSLEDRLVKQAFRDYATGGDFEVLTRRPVVASPEEERTNPRSRSAKLRVLERLE